MMSLQGLHSGGIMIGRQMASFIFSCLGLLLVAGLVFLFLKLFQIPCGHTIDWMIGLVSIFWLFTITTVPWNVYFEAKAVLDEAAQSRASGIALDESQVKYAGRIKGLSLSCALALHLLSTLGLFYLAYAQISPVGYYGALAALLLAGLRPALRGYEYLWRKLSAIRQRVLYPREDVVELRSRTRELELELAGLKLRLSPESPESIQAEYRRLIEFLRKDLDQIALNHTVLVENNRHEHEQLLRESQGAIAKLSADSQFLDHVREIIKMIKSA